MPEPFPRSTGCAAYSYRRDDASRRIAMDLSRRELLAVGGLTLTGAALAPKPAIGQTPKRGGTLALRLWDPPHFDLHAAGGLSYKLHILMTFTHSRLVRHKAGPGVQPGTFAIEPDLAESWTQPNETTY